MKSVILTNGYQSPYVSVTRGIRQGDSLSALLYIIQAEPLFAYIRNNNDFEGIRLGDQRIIVKGCQYVDDSVLLPNKKNTAPLWINAVKEFGKASGSTLNMIKTVGLRTNSHDDPDIPIKFTSDSEKLLGIPVGYQINKDEHWDKLIQKMMSKITPWKQRNLSYGGKVHILKSLGLSQLLYSIEMMDINKKFINRIQKIIWDFMWEEKRCMVKPEVCMLPKNKGGLDIPCFDALRKVRRLKMLINLLEHPGPWCTLALRHLQCLDDKYGIPYFALQSDNSEKEVNDTNIPQFYKECILAFQELSQKGKVIYALNIELLWCNSKVTLNGMSLKYKHWAKCEMIRVQDVVHNSSLDATFIQSKLINKSAFIFEYEKLKKSILPSWLNEKHHVQTVQNCAPKNLLEMKFKIPGGMEKCPEENINFDKWFKVIHMVKLCQRKSLDFNWRIFHGHINTEIRLEKMRLSDGICKLCNIEKENVDHLLVQCKKSASVWHKIQQLVNTIGESDAISHFHKVVGYIHDGELFDVMNMMFSLCRWTIWKRRCLNRYEGVYKHWPTREMDP